MDISSKRPKFGRRFFAALGLMLFTGELKATGIKANSRLLPVQAMVC